MPSKPPLIRPPHDIVKELPDKVYKLIGETVSAWSRLDMALLHMLMDVTGADAGIIGLLIGRLDSRGKFDRLVSILEYRGLNDHLTALRKLRPDIAKMQKRRNDVAHGDLIGIHKSSRDFLFVVADYWADEETKVPVLSICGYSEEKLEWNAREIKRLSHELQKINIPKP